MALRVSGEGEPDGGLAGLVAIERTAMSPMSRPLVSMPIWIHTPGWANRTLRIWAMSARALSRGYGVSHDW